MMNIVAVSGSLRRISSNTELLRAATLLAPAEMRITLYADLGNLPQFSPDLDENAPPIVEVWRQLLLDADGVLICSPEYAHGIVGALKNALDWVVGTMNLVGKPVGLINVSARAVHAQAALHEVVTTMGWNIVADASPVIAVQGKNLDAAAIAADTDLAAQVRASLAALQQAISEQRANG